MIPPQITAEGPMSTKSRPIPINPVWQRLLRNPACARQGHFSGELPLEPGSLHRRAPSTTILPCTCIFLVINRQYRPATRLSRGYRHTLRVSSTPSLPSDTQHDLAEMSVGAHMRLRRRRLIEREDAVDRQLELARLDQRPQIGAHLAIDLAHLF